MGDASSKKAKPRRRRRNWLPFWLILPTVLVLLAIQVYPVFYTLVLSVQERKPTGWEFVGLKNFETLAGFLGAGRERWSHHRVPGGLREPDAQPGVLIALLLNRKSRLVRLLHHLAVHPVDPRRHHRRRGIPAAGLARLRAFLRHPAEPGDFPPKGLSILTADAARPWIGDFPFPPSPAMIYLILAATWRALPFITLLMLAALQTVSNEVIESSRIDGANRWQTIRHITVPLILPTMVVALFSLTLGGINGVGMVFSLTGGGPGTSTPCSATCCTPSAGYRWTSAGRPRWLCCWPWLT